MNADVLPLLPVEMVVLPTELVAIHISEPRFERMINDCVDSKRNFGIVWLSADGLHEIGCACRTERLLERYPDGRIHLLAEGIKPFQLLERHNEFDYPAGKVRFLADDSEPNEQLLDQAHSAYATLLQKAADRTIAETDLNKLNAYDMAATVDLTLDAKQRLLELREENQRLELITQLMRAAARILDFSDRMQARARSNGKVTPT